MRMSVWWFGRIPPAHLPLPVEGIKGIEEDVRMMVSTKGRYALRVMTDLAVTAGDGYTSLKGIAARQALSLKYLEMIVAILNKSGLVLSQRGKEGGYRLARPADEITVAQVLSLTEGTLAPVSCLDKRSGVCERAGDCLTLPMWKKLDTLIDGYLSQVTIQNLIDGTLDKQ